MPGASRAGLGGSAPPERAGVGFMATDGEQTPAPHNAIRANRIERTIGERAERVTRDSQRSDARKTTALAPFSRTSSRSKLPPNRYRAACTNFHPAASGRYGQVNEAAS